MAYLSLILFRHCPLLFVKYSGETNLLLFVCPCSFLALFSGIFLGQPKAFLTCARTMFYTFSSGTRLCYKFSDSVPAFACGSFYFLIMCLTCNSIRRGKLALAYCFPSTGYEQTKWDSLHAFSTYCLFSSCIG